MHPSMAMVGHSERRTRSEQERGWPPGIWLAVALASVGAFLGILWEPTFSADPEMDLWWYVPTVLQHVAGQSAWETFLYMVQPGPLLFESPALKFFPWLVHGCLGWPFGFLVLISVLFHVANAGLLFVVGRQLGFQARACFLSSLIFLSMFAHFHAALWPTAVHHVTAVFSILLILSLYLKSEQDPTPARGRGLFYGLTMAAAAVGSIQRSTLFVPLLLLAHIGAVSGSPEERGRRYDRWMPLFLFYPVHSILGISFTGDLVTVTAVSESPLPPALKASLLMAAAVGMVWLGRWVIRWRVAGRLVAWAVVVGFLLLFPLKDKRQLLFLYNGLVPLMTTLSSFLDPFQSALRIDAVSPYHFIPAQVNPANLWVTVLFLVSFSVLFIRRQRALWILPVWYAACLSYVMFHAHVASSFPIQMVSRYLVYFSPLAAWVLASVAVALADAVGRIWPVRRRTRDLVLTAVVMSLCLANLLAIRVAFFRGRWVNTYGSYDDMRVAHLIGEDLTKLSHGRAAGASFSVAIEQMVPLSYDPQSDFARHVPLDEIAFGNLRVVLSNTLRGLPVHQVQINPDGSRLPAETRRYRVADGLVQDSVGRPIDPFVERFNGGDFRGAAEVRPFLLRYLLGGCRLEDQRWVTGGAGLRPWLERVIRYYQSTQPIRRDKQERTAAVVRKELLDYALCLLGASERAHRDGRREENRSWMCQLYHLEPDPEVLLFWLSQHPRVKEEAALREHLERVRQADFFQNPIPWKMDDYGFGRFLIRLVFHRDIRSRWDRTQVRI